MYCPQHAGVLTPASQYIHPCRHDLARVNADTEIERLREENERLTAAYMHLVERLRLATPQSLMAVTDAALLGQGET